MYACFFVCICLCVCVLPPRPAQTPHIFPIQLDPGAQTQTYTGPKWKRWGVTAWQIDPVYWRGSNQRPQLTSLERYRPHPPQDLTTLQIITSGWGSQCGGQSFTALKRWYDCHPDCRLSHSVIIWSSIILQRSFKKHSSDNYYFYKISFYRASIPSTIKQ